MTAFLSLLVFLFLVVREEVDGVLFQVLPAVVVTHHRLRVFGSMTLLRYFTRLSLQSEGWIFSIIEAANASGYEACLSVPTVNSNLRWSALINFLKKRFAAETSRLAVSINSICYFLLYLGLIDPI